MTMKTASPTIVGWRQMTAVGGQRESSVVKDLSTKTGERTRVVRCRVDPDPVLLYAVEAT